MGFGPRATTVTLRSASKNFSAGCTVCGEKNNHINLPGEELFSKFQGFQIGGQGNFAHRWSMKRLAPIRLNQAANFCAAAAFQR
jgi:hypothetical protein